MARMRVGAGVLGLALMAGGAVWASGASSQVVARELLRLARDRGSVRVIVHLQVVAGADESAIESVKQAVLAQIAPTRHQVLRELPGVPLLALEASWDTLRVLSASRAVVRVEEDALAAPQQ